MVQRTCSVDKNSRVVITAVSGNLHMHAWKELLIVAEAEGPIAEFRQEDQTLIISDCQSHLALWAPCLGDRYPAITGSGITTAIDVAQLGGNVTIEAADQVKLSDIGGNVTLRDIAGDVTLESIHGVATLTHIRGDVQRVGTAEIIAVRGDLEATAIEGAIRCTTVGGDCWVRNSPLAEIGISNVAENLDMEGVAHGRMSNIGGDLELRATFPAGSTTRFHVENNAVVTLPEDASLILHALIGGEVSGEALGSSGGGFLDLVYGAGAATLNLHIGGDLKLLGAVTPRGTSLS